MEITGREKSVSHHGRAGATFRATRHEEEGLTNVNTRDVNLVEINYLFRMYFRSYRFDIRDLAVYPAAYLSPSLTAPHGDDFKM